MEADQFEIRGLMPATCIWYWPRDFVLRTRDFEQPKSYRRASITLLVTTGAHLTLNCASQNMAVTGAILLGPAVERGQLSIRGAKHQHGWILDYAPGSEGFLRLKAALGGRKYWTLPASEANPFQQALHEIGANSKRVDLQRIHADFAQKHGAGAKIPDQRVLDALKLIDEACLDEIQISRIAKVVALSESRLRSVVRGHLGCNLAQYARWSAAWRVLLNWQTGMTLTDAAHAGGFHDLAHANHAANDMFGMSPSRALNRNRLRLIDCREAIESAQSIYTSGVNKTK